MANSLYINPSFSGLYILFCLYILFFLNLEYIKSTDINTSVKTKGLSITVKYGMSTVNYNHHFHSRREFLLYKGFG